MPTPGRRTERVSPHILAVLVLLLLVGCTAAAPPAPERTSPPPRILDLVREAPGAPGGTVSQPFRLAPRRPLLGDGWAEEEGRWVARGGKAVIKLPFRPLADDPARVTLLLLRPLHDPEGTLAATLNGHTVHASPLDEGRALAVELPASGFIDGENVLALTSPGALELAALEVALPAAAARLTQGRLLRSALLSGGPIVLDSPVPLAEGASLELSYLAVPELLPPGVASTRLEVTVERLDPPAGAEHPAPEVVLATDAVDGATVAAWRDASIPLDGHAGQRVRIHLRAVVPEGADARVLHAWGPVTLVVEGRPRRGAGTRVDSLILMVVDTLRADSVGAWGSPAMATPFLDRLAARNVVLEDVLAQGSATVPSLASFFGGRYFASTRGAGEHAGSHGPPTFAPTLQGTGIHGIALMTNPILSAEWGYARGFAEYDHARVYGTAAEVNAAFLWRLRWLERGPRLFAYLHYMDVHDPYGPRGYQPEPFQGEALRDLAWDGSLRDLAGVLERSGPSAIPAEDRGIVERAYLAGIASWDEELGKLLAQLRKRRTLDRTTIAILADHGEELWDHGLIGHGHSVYRELLHVPVVLAPAGWETRHLPVRIAAPLEMLDVSATLLAIMGAPIPADHEGRPLALGHASAASDGERFFVSPSRPLARPPFDASPSGIERGRWKLVREKDAAVHLFDIAVDPRELDDVSGRHPDVVASLLEALERGPRERAPEDATGNEPSEAMRAQEEEALRALGYVR